MKTLLPCLLTFLLLNACAGENEPGDDGSEGPGETKSASPSPTTPSNQWSPTPPSTPSAAATDVPSPSASTPAPESSAPTPSSTTNPPPAPTPELGEKMATCTATKTSGSTTLRSDVKLYYAPLPNGTSVSLKRFEFVVKGFGNPDNDADIYSVAGTTTTKLFNTGDKLKENTTVTIDAGGRSIPLSSKVRVSTNFDKSFATDPSAACDLTL